MRPYESHPRPEARRTRSARLGRGAGSRARPRTRSSSDVRATAVNRADLLQSQGKYPPPPGASEILGLEAAGEVEGTGERVFFLLAGGGYAEKVAVPRAMLMPIPPALSFEEAAAIPEAWFTAYLNLFQEGGLKAGERVLVHAAASGVGTAAIQLAKRAGASVVATARSAKKCVALVALGADLAVDTSREEFLSRIEQTFGKESVDLVLDPWAARSSRRTSRRSAAEDASSSSRAWPGRRREIDLRIVLVKRLRIIGSTLRSRPLDGEDRPDGRVREGRPARLRATARSSPWSTGASRSPRPPRPTAGWPRTRTWARSCSSRTETWRRFRPTRARSSSTSTARSSTPTRRSTSRSAPSSTRSAVRPSRATRRAGWSATASRCSSRRPWARRTSPKACGSSASATRESGSKSTRLLPGADARHAEALRGGHPPRDRLQQAGPLHAAAPRVGSASRAASASSRGPDDGFPPKPAPHMVFMALATMARPGAETRCSSGDMPIDVATARAAELSDHRTSERQRDTRRARSVFSDADRRKSRRALCRCSCPRRIRAMSKLRFDHRLSPARCASSTRAPCGCGRRCCRR